MTKAPLIMLDRPSKPPRRARSCRCVQMFFRPSDISTGLESLLVPASSAGAQNSGGSMTIE